MKLLLYLLIANSFLSEYLDVMDRVGRFSLVLKYMPDLIASCLVIVIIIVAANNKRLLIAPRYIAIAAMLIVLVLAGIVMNQMDSGTVVNGLRTYLKYLPLFLLPAVHDFSDQEISRLLKFVLALSLIQLPIALFQRFYQASTAQLATGDVVRGSLASSGILSVFLISIIVMVFAFYLRRRIRFSWFVLIVAVLFVPTTINETRGTVVLLPIALLAMTFFNAKAAGRFRSLAIASIMGAAMLGIVAQIYDQLYQNQEGEGLVSFYLSGGAFSDTYKRTAVGESKSVGRIDAIIYAWEELSQDIPSLFVGLGVGNVQKTGFSLLSGQYADQYSEHGVGKNTVSKLLWELGVLGVVLMLLLLYALFLDARRLRRGDDGFAGTIALGWMGVLTVMFLSLLYKNLIVHDVLGALFLFFSGYVAAKRLELRVIPAQPNPDWRGAGQAGLSEVQR